jgi:hypothetical protein
MLRRKFYPAAIKYLREAIEKWDRDDQDLAQVLITHITSSFQGKILESIFQVVDERG